MKLTAPIYQLKRNAKALSREHSIPLHAALDRIALQEGYDGWSLLAARHAAISPASLLYGKLNEGDLILIGARPGLGKTLMALELAIEAMKAGRHGFFFTLDYTEKDIVARFRALGSEPERYGELFAFDCSDAIDADYIITELARAPRGTLVVIDYLQLLDQRRVSPSLADQVTALKSFAREQGLIIAFVSQIDRNYDPARESYPSLEDVRMPNPLDLALFDKSCFLNGSGVRFHADN